MAKRPILTNNIQGLFKMDPEMQRFLMDLSGITSDVDEISIDISKKADKVEGGAENNIVTLDSVGNIQDSGKSFSDVVLKKRSSITVDSDYEVLVADEIIWVDASAGPTLITLYPSLTIAGQTFIIEKIDSTDNYVRVAGDSETINDDSYFDLLLQYESVEPTSTGDGYLI